MPGTRTIGAQTPQYQPHLQENSSTHRKYLLPAASVRGKNPSSDKVRRKTRRRRCRQISWPARLLERLCGRNCDLRPGNLLSTSTAQPDLHRKAGAPPAPAFRKPPGTLWKSLRSPAKTEKKMCKRQKIPLDIASHKLYMLTKKSILSPHFRGG